MSEHTLGFIGPYQVLEQLGRGGMGVVYRARDPRSGALVAVKTVSVPDIRTLASIRREIHALERLRHPGVVRVLGHGVHKGLPWYAMELLTCRTLTEELHAAWLRRGVAIPDRTAPRMGTSSRWMDAATLTRDSALPGRPQPRDGARGSDRGSDRRDRRDAEPVMAGYRATDLPGRDRAWPTLGNTLTEWTALVSSVPYRKELRDGTGDNGRPDPGGPRPPAAAGELTQALRVVLRLTEILVVVHGAGLVHRDLKPDNIFVRDGGEPVLVDFGLVAYGAAGREILGDPNMAAGTLHYMAPEQLRGEYVDARGDLYSLGCILYECITGKPPFTDGNKGTVVLQQLHDQPPPPSRYVDGVPPRLDALTLALLAKSPRDRIGYASDVAAELGALIDAPVALPASLVTACHQLYRPSFIGRDGEMARLWAHIDALDHGRGAMILVCGGPGVGKTRLLMELLRRVGSVRALRITGECVAVGLDEHPDLRINGAPLHPFDRLLQHVIDRCHHHGGHETERLLGRELRVLCELEPALLGVPGAERAPEVPPLPGDAARQRVIDALWLLMTRLAEDVPLVFILDDLQWADELSLAFLDSLCRRDLSRVPVLIIAACRDRALPGALRALMASQKNLTTTATATATTTAVSTAMGAPELVAVEPLDAVSIHMIISDMLALDQPPTWLIEHLDPGHAGNPFYVAEFLQMAREQGVLERADTGRWTITEAEHALPRSLQAVCRRRLSALGPLTRRVVDMASTMGRVLDVDMLARVGGLGEAEVLEAVDELIVRKLVQKNMSGALSFVHEAICQVAHDELDGDARRALHHAVATELERQLERRATVRELPLLAHHFGAAGIADKAFEYLVKNARATLDAGAHQQAMLMMERAWALAGDSGRAPLFLSAQERANAALLTAEAAFGLGRLDLAERRAEEALALRGYRVPRTSAAWTVGLLRGIGGQLVSSLRRRRDRARPARAPRDGQASIDCARALALLQGLYVAQSDLLRIMASCFMAANEAERAGPPTSPAVAYSIIGSACGSAGLTGLCADYFERAHALARDQGNPHTEVSIAITEHLYYLGAGMWQPLEDSAERLLELAWDIGARFEWEALMMIWQTYRLRRHGRAGVSEALARVIASAEARCNPLSRAFAQVRAGECALVAGTPMIALELARAARPVLADSGPPAMSARAEALMAAALYERGAHDQARIAAEGALAGLESTLLLHLHEDGCRHVAEVFLGLWERARISGSRDAAVLRRKALAACKLMRGQGRRFAASRAPALRLQAVARRIDGKPARARALLEQAMSQARTAALQPEQGLILIEMARCHVPGSEQRARLARRARTVLDRCGWNGGLEIIDSLR